MSISLHNGMAVVDGDWISKEMMERGVECDMMLRDILPHLKYGDWVIDVGAAMGDHTAAYLRTVGEHGKVFAFEPNHEYFHCLQHNCPRAIHFNRPLWSGRETPFWLHSPVGNQGAGELSNDSKPRTDQDIVSGPVLSLKLDDFGLIRLDYMKLDCEGAEYHVLLGGSETIKRLKPKMVIEMNPGPTENMGLTHMHIYNLLDDFGYDYKSIRNESGRHCKSCDIFCWPK